MVVSVKEKYKAVKGFRKCVGSIQGGQLLSQELQWRVRATHQPGGRTFQAED